MYKKLILLVLILSSCDSKPSKIDIYLDTKSTPKWIDDALVNTVAFWSEHGVTLIPGPEGTITFTVQELPPDRVAQWESHLEWYTGNISIIPIMEDSLLTSCTLAHEIGHALGMNHVREDNSLMSPVVHKNGLDSCYWSRLDQEEFCRIHKPSCQ